MIKFVRATALVLLLACSALAGDIQNGSPQPSSSTTTSTSTTDESATTGTAAESDASTDVADPLTEAALSLLNNVLALL